MPVSTPGASAMFLCHASLTLSTCCRGQSQPSARPVWPEPASLSSTRPLSTAGTDTAGPLSHGSILSAHSRAQRATRRRGLPSHLPSGRPLRPPRCSCPSLIIICRLSLPLSFLCFVRRSVPGPLALSGISVNAAWLERGQSDGWTELRGVDTAPCLPPGESWPRREPVGREPTRLRAGRQGGRRLCGEPSSGSVPPKSFLHRCWGSGGHF